MCGISGFFSANSSGLGESLVARIVRHQNKRGPDAQAVSTVSAQEPHVVLGHNRLSIVDLSEASNQPLWDHERRVCVVFNGEIYNYLELRNELRRLGHEFHTQGDSEVILEAYKEWGIDAVERFIGMFAFALWDTATRELWLVRDRFGVKPLFYRQGPEGVAFASTPTVMAQYFGLDPNLDYVADGIELRMYERDDDIAPYRGIHALPGGCLARVTLDPASQVRLEVRRYYDLGAKVVARRASLLEKNDRDWIEETRGCLESAIDLRLRSDVPLGLSLSGGIDSSTIGALVARRQPNLFAFTFGSPEDEFSEGRNVAAIAAKVGIKVTYCQPTIAEVIDRLRVTIAAQDAPFPGGSIIAQHFVFEAARAQGIIVLLGGQGADEALMGYHKFKVFLLQDALRNYRYGTALSLAAWMGALLASEGTNLAGYWRERHRFLPSKRAAQRTPLFTRTAPLPDQRLGSDTAVWQRQLLDVTRFSLPTLLRYEDRNSMGNSVESRLPFLDHRFIELGLALPDAVKVRHGFGKWVLREVARDLIPEPIRTLRKKRGFDVNLQRWIQGGLGAAMRSQLQEQQDLFRPMLTRTPNFSAEFSDPALVRSPHAFAEAVSLLWLAQTRLAALSRNS